MGGDVLQVMGVVKLLSTHDKEEEYIATRSDEGTWTSNPLDDTHWKRYPHPV